MIVPPENAIAETWVAGFAERWRAPAGPNAFAAHFRELLALDVRLIQPQLPTVDVIVKRPRAWPGFLRLRARQILNSRAKRSRA